MFRRRPPYAKAAQAALDNERPVLGGVLLVAAGRHAWHLIHYWRSLEPMPPAVCVPPGEAPQAFDWTLVRARAVWLYPDADIDDTACEALARCLLFAGAQRVEVVRAAAETLAFNPNRKVA